MNKPLTPLTSHTESALLQLPLRLLLGGLMMYAAYNKIPAIQSFAEAIKGFGVLDVESHSELIIIAAFVIPWFELIAGLLLLIGLRGRSAALGIGLLLIMFIAGLLNVIFGDIDADCSCFGDANIVCGSSVGWCQVIRNLILLIPAGYLVWRGPGRLSLDHILSGSNQSPDTHAYQAQSSGSVVDQDPSRA